MIDRRWHILGVLFLARTAMGFQFQSVASTAPLLIAELHLGYAAIGTLIGLYMLPGILIAFPGGLLSRSFGDKAVCAAGLVLMIVGGLLLGSAPTPTWVFAGRLVSGTGAVLFNLVLTKMTTDWFAGREIVLAMGVVLASWPFGIAAGLLMQPALAAAQGWRAVMGLTAAVCGLALLLIAAVYRATPRAASPPATSASGTPSAVPALPPWRQMLPTIVAGVMWGNLNLALVLFFSFGPAALTALGVAPAAAAAWAGAALWVVMVSVPLGGLAVQRSGRPDAAIVVFCLARRRGAGAATCRRPAASNGGGVRHRHRPAGGGDHVAASAGARPRASRRRPRRVPDLLLRHPERRAGAGRDAARALGQRRRSAVRRRLTGRRRAAVVAVRLARPSDVVRRRVGASHKQNRRVAEIGVRLVSPGPPPRQPMGVVQNVRFIGYTKTR